jgi:hypothetical protein
VKSVDTGGYEKRIIRYDATFDPAQRTLLRLQFEYDQFELAQTYKIDPSYQDRRLADRTDGVAALSW